MRSRKWCGSGWLCLRWHKPRETEIQVKVSFIGVDASGANITNGGSNGGYRSNRNMIGRWCQKNYFNLIDVKF